MYGNAGSPEACAQAAPEDATMREREKMQIAKILFIINLDLIPSKEATNDPR